MEPTFGGINLEDIKAPECFYIETKLRERMKIPVFHDDQHGTAIVAAAAILNALKHVGKDIARGQAGGLGRRRRGAGLPGPDREPRPADARTSSCPTAKGVVYIGRNGEHGPEQGALRAATPAARTLADMIARRRHLPRPVGRRRAQARDGQGRWRATRSSSRWPTRRRRSCRRTRWRCGPTRSSAPAARTIRTRSTTSCASRSSSAARSTCGATTINEEMKLAAVRAIAELAHAEIPEVVAQAYGARRPALRPRLPDPQALRPAPDRGRRAGGGPGRDGQRRGDAADRRHDGLPPAPVAVRLPVGQQHAAAVRGRQAARPSAWSMPKARTSACCAPRRWWSTKAWRGRCCSAAPR